MPLAQFRDEVRGICVTRRMFAPTTAGAEKAWFKQARSVIPAIPDPKRTDWSVCTPEVSLAYIKWEMLNTIGERCWVIIDRRVSAM